MIHCHDGIAGCQPDQARCTCTCLDCQDAAHEQPIPGAYGIPRPFDSLTPRQCEIARLIATGHTSAQIGAQLGLSEKTVDSHRMAVCNRLGIAPSSARAVRLTRLAIQVGLVSSLAEDDAPIGPRDKS